MISPNWRRAATISSAMLVQVMAQAAADPLPLPSGLYDVTSRLELPHLERWGIDQTTRVCLFRRDEEIAIPVPILSSNNPFEKCTTSHVVIENATFQYDIVCTGRDAAKAHAVYQLASGTFAGRVAMVMGAKNMTMTEVQSAKRVGTCGPAE
jgi:Protein of unknown function (DUF3617)